MQTFLPYPDLFESAESLDKRRCWKQVIEAKQIIDSIESGLTTGWKNHPATRMWVGHAEWLKAYFNAMLQVTKNVHHVKTAYEEYFVDFSLVTLPWWYNNENFHRAMRARLIEKNREFYLPKFPEDEGFNGGKYLWPVMDGSNTFRVI